MLIYYGRSVRNTAAHKTLFFLILPLPKKKITSAWIFSTLSSFSKSKKKNVFWDEIMLYFYKNNKNFEEDLSVTGKTFSPGNISTKNFNDIFNK